MGVRRLFLIFILIIPFFTSAARTEGADVVVVGDVRLKPVNDIITALRDSVSYETVAYSPGEVRGTLNAIVKNENAKVVVALGGDAVAEALSLPESVPLIYGLLIKPAVAKRQNTTGVYMTTPVAEYVSLLEKYFPNIRRLGTVVEPETGGPAVNVHTASVSFYKAGNSYEFIKSVKQFSGNIDAFILLPEKNLLTATAMEELYRYSFTEKVPVIGVSEKHVKMGSLLALVFDEAGMGRQIGELVDRVLSRGSASGMAPAPPERFKLYLNSETARTMNINIPGELLRKAKVIYP